MAKLTEQRPDFNQLLRQVQAEEQEQRGSKLKIFLGYSEGVGKSFRMLDEGRRRRERGEDVVVGAVQPKVPDEINSLLQSLEVISCKTIAGVPVMDLSSIVARHPQVCLVDGLAYDNPPGSAHATRWQDVQELLAAGISVIASVNLQFIEERRDQVEKITGKHVSATVPLSFLKAADEIELVDAPPELCMVRAVQGAKPAGVLATRQQQLSELREIALLLAADVVDHQLEAYMRSHGIEQLWGAQERILVYITSQTQTGSAKMIESGRRNSERFHGELFVAYLGRPGITAKDHAALHSNISLARAAGAQVVALDGDDPVDAILEFAKARGVTQIFVGQTSHRGWRDRLFGTVVDDLARVAQGIDVRIFPQ
jgi:two-component system, OmpR family, sensor histidine kinase KdpD